MKHIKVPPDFRAPRSAALALPFASLLGLPRKAIAEVRGLSSKAKASASAAPERIRRLAASAAASIRGLAGRLDQGADDGEKEHKEFRDGIKKRKRKRERQKERERERQKQVDDAEDEERKRREGAERAPSAESDACAKHAALVERARCALIVRRGIELGVAPQAAALAFGTSFNTDAAIALVDRLASLSNQA